ncbi:MAG: sigma-70 family RNA polymerase sigma factor [Spirochaetaceae bacterium]|nr:sigma-70 family RNA polymerase sigma factor [Spirochaetaceae bacterium]
MMKTNKSIQSNNSYNLIINNMALINKLVNEIEFSTLETEDLTQQAVLLLLDKINEYDSSKGALSTFIWFKIKNKLINSTQVIPERLYKKSVSIKKVKEYLISQGTELTDENIASCLGWSVKTYRYYKKLIYIYREIDMDCFSSEEDEDDVSFVYKVSANNTLSPEQIFMNKTMCHELLNVVNSLPGDQKKVVTLHYNLNHHENGPLSLREIAKMLNVSHQTAANIESKAFNTIKKFVA